ncbi:hypothetical protein T484DRAFT_1789109 [Baffinella frigidus]|nr:hypothetical protein T484DRAFT_1789109 [Cryptophyta sp. CCMP2293]
MLKGRIDMLISDFAVAQTRLDTAERQVESLRFQMQASGKKHDSEVESLRFQMQAAGEKHDSEVDDLRRGAAGAVADARARRKAEEASFEDLLSFAFRSLLNLAHAQEFHSE